jgi:hypothetical protein
MELTLEGHQSFHVEGSIAIELPDYMTLLPPDELKWAQTSDNRDELIVAAGRHPEGDVVFLTAAGELKEISWKENGLPHFGKIVPINRGQALCIEIDERQSIEVNNHWALDCSRRIVFLGAVAEPGKTLISYLQK